MSIVLLNGHFQDLLYKLKYGQGMLSTDCPDKQNSEIVSHTVTESESA